VEYHWLVSTEARLPGYTDVLVNNAGMLVAGPFLELSPADWERQLSVNLMGVVHGCRAFGAQMVERGAGGHIVNIASAAAFTPTPARRPAARPIR
jgi:NAD(P)-dependent dehydrogenase (short-subunit alcohol dehydrogenase family)